MNTIGRLFRLTSFGESHGIALGGVVDGCPAGLPLDFDQIKHAVQMRSPGQSEFMTSRKETDEIEWLSGIVDGKTTGAPIAFIIRNEDVRSADYSRMTEVFRPGHADYTYFQKYGIKPQSGGGRSSARETVVRVVAGAIAKQLLGNKIDILAYASSIGSVSVPNDIIPDRNSVEDSIVRCPDEKATEAMKQLIKKVKNEGDSIGGVVSCIVKGVPAGWGEPVYDKLPARLASAMMSINAAKGFEMGDGFGIAVKQGSEVNGSITTDSGTVTFSSNHFGGTLGGISTGLDLFFRVVFKPVPTIGKAQRTIDTHMQNAVLECAGRHDPCVVPRAVPVVEAMAALVLADLYLLAKSSEYFY